VDASGCVCVCVCVRRGGGGVDYGRTTSAASACWSWAVGSGSEGSPQARAHDRCCRWPCRPPPPAVAYGGARQRH
jgi:hypothetical protein